MLRGGRCSLFVVRCLMYGGGCVLSAGCYLLCVIVCYSVLFCCLLFVVRCLWFAGVSRRCVLFVVCCWLMCVVGGLLCVAACRVVFAA